MDYPQECGSPSMRFVDCSTGEVLKTIDLWAWKDGYWHAVYRDKTKGKLVKLFLEGEDNIKSKLKSAVFEEPWLCVIEKDSRMFVLINSLYEYSLTWNGTNAGSLSETKNVNSKTWIRPKETTFYEMVSCKYLNTIHHEGLFDYGPLKDYDTHLYEVELVPVTFGENPVYHKDADPLYEDLAEQGIDPSGITNEDREQRHDKWLAHYIANQFDWKILNII